MSDLSAFPQDPQLQGVADAKRGLAALGIWPFGFNDVVDARYKRRILALQTILDAAGYGGQDFRANPIQTNDIEVLRAAASLNMVDEQVLADQRYDVLNVALNSWLSQYGDMLPETRSASVAHDVSQIDDPASKFNPFSIDDQRLAAADEASAAASADAASPTTSTGQEGVAISGDAAAQPTVARTAGDALLGIAGGAQLWKVDDKYWFVVYEVPGTEPPVRMAWGVESFDAMERLTGNRLEPQPDRVLSSGEFNGEGTLNMGISAEIVNSSEHPFAALVSNFDRIVTTQPWMRDPEILGLTMGALIEGRDLSDAELKSTNWWRTRTEGERAWAALVASDPETAQQQMKDSRIQVRDLFRRAGIDEAPDALVDFLASKQTTGVWTDTQVTAQIDALGNPESSFDVNSEVRSFLDTEGLAVDTTADQRSEVKSMALRWLGPVHGSWSESKIARWANKIRNEPGAADELENLLRNQRLALFPEYQDERLTYEDIAGPWATMVQQQWGQVADEKDPFFSKLVRANDAGVASQMLRQEGLQRGITNVVNEATAALGTAFGGSVRRAV